MLYKEEPTYNEANIPFHGSHFVNLCRNDSRLCCYNDQVIKEHAILLFSSPHYRVERCSCCIALGCSNDFFRKLPSYITERFHSHVINCTHLRKCRVDKTTPVPLMFPASLQPLFKFCNMTFSLNGFLILHGNYRL